MRVSILLTVLVVVIAYAGHDIATRHARKAWDHTLSVAIVLVQPTGSSSDPDALVRFREGVPVLEARMEAELHRYKPSAPKPFAFTVYGPVDVNGPPPTAASEGLLDLAAQSWNLRRYVRDVDDRAKVFSAAFDSRIYVTVTSATNAKTKMVEGSSEQGGRVGCVSVELGGAIGMDGEVPAAVMADVALAVIAHELFHTLDATDKYDDAGRVRVPDGLVEPNASPRFPQQYAEIMTRGRLISETQEKTIDSLDELGVGPMTARELGWSTR